MIKKFGLTFGGLQQKILNLVLISLLVTVIVFLGASIHQGSTLAKLVSTSSDKQQEAISAVSENTMNAIIDSSMVKTNALQAYIAEDMFTDVKNDVLTMQAFANGLFQVEDQCARQTINYAVADNDGIPTVQYMHESGADTQSRYLTVVSNMGDIMLSMYKTADKLESCYVATPDGHIIIVNDRAGAYVDDKGRPMRILDVTNRPWYKMAVETGDVCFSDIYQDSHTGIDAVACVAPVYKDGELVCVVGADVFLTNMAEYVNSSSNSGGFVSVVDGSGRMIFSPMTEGPFAPYNSDKNTSCPELDEFFKDALEESTGIRKITADGVEYYLAGSPLKSVNWAVVSVVERSVTLIPTQQLINECNTISNSARAEYKAGFSLYNNIILVVVVLILVLGLAASMILANRIVYPVEDMTKTIIESGNTGKMFEMKDLYKTGDEIEVLAESFDDLAKKTRQYILDITRITAEKERIGAELDLARKIQADMLPNIFPPFPERTEFDVYASMKPAKEVGGDFYDFFLIDDDHLGLVMADVSGKGVPAALFMMMSKILVNNYAMMGGSPAKVLEQVNAAICKNNEEEMFVTVWLGVFEISTGSVTAANAGHEYPMIKKADGSFELFKDKHGFVVGGMEGVKYKDYTFTVEKGGSLFLYTDGVAEATNADEQLFGTDRMLEALNKEPGAEPAALLENMTAALDGFVGEAPQFDDITMLALIRR